MASVVSVSWLYNCCSYKYYNTNRGISGSVCSDKEGVSVTTRSEPCNKPLLCCFCTSTHNSYRSLHQHEYEDQKIIRKPTISICVEQIEGDDGQGKTTPPTTTTSRSRSRSSRRLMLQAPLIASSFPRFLSDIALAATNDNVPPDFQPYTDDMNKFKIFIPQDWQVGAGEPNGFKSVTAFFPVDQEAANSNVSVVITGLGPDFTRMESFGKVEAFADTLVSGLDRSWQRPPGVAAKLIDCKAANGFYYIEYTLQKPGESRKHLFSAIGMASNGWYNRLYTVTGQFVEEEGEKYGSKIEKAVSSFRFI